MTFAQAIGQALRQYARFRGIASRRAYWFWRLFLALVSIVSSVIDEVLAKQFGQDPNWFIPLQALTGLAFFLPDLAVSARRLRDAGKSAYNLLWQALPVVVVAVTLPVVLTEIAGQPEAIVPNLSPMATGLMLATAFSTIGVGVYMLVLLLRPSKSAAQGNKYATE